MKIHEYQAKELLAAAGAPIPKGTVASSPAEAVAAINEVKVEPVAGIDEAASGVDRG